MRSEFEKKGVFFYSHGAEAEHNVRSSAPASESFARCIHAAHVTSPEIKNSFPVVEQEHTANAFAPTASAAVAILSN